MAQSMGLHRVGGSHCLRKFRYMFRLRGVAGLVSEDMPGIAALPPKASARPDIQFKEMSVHHVNEDIYFPAKADWKPIQLMLYDMSQQRHPVFQWMRKHYDPQSGKVYPPTENEFIKIADLEMYDGVGNVLERWVYEDVWPQSINFGTLDMQDADVMTCDLQLRYARAYILQPESEV